MAETSSSEKFNLATQDKIVAQSTMKLDSSDSDDDMLGIYSNDLSNLTTPEDTTPKNYISSMKPYETEINANDQNLSSSSLDTINETEINTQNDEIDINEQTSDIFGDLIKFNDEEIEFANIDDEENEFANIDDEENEFANIDDEENEFANIKDIESSRGTSTFKGKKKANNNSFPSGNKSNNAMMTMNEKYPMLWHSDPIDIPISILKSRSIHYRYFLYEEKHFFFKFIDMITNKKQPFENNVPDITIESNSWHHDQIYREFNFNENQFDIWDSTEKFPIKKNDVQLNYPYFSIIHQSVTEKNLKAKIIEYQKFYGIHQRYLNYDMLESFIFKEFNISSIIEQKIFLGVLLGCLINGKVGESYMPQGYILPEKFPSNDMLQAFKNINLNDLPHGVVKPLSLAVCALVNHISTYSTNFEWMNVFEIAPNVDPRYTFLRHVKVPAYRNKNVSEFKDSLQNLVKPYTDIIKSDYNYTIVCKHLINLCREIVTIVFLWKSIFRPGSNQYDDLNEFSLDSINNIISIDNANQLAMHLEEIPYDFDIDFASRFRGRVFELLNNTGTSWNKNSIDSMHGLLNNEKLSWHKDSVLRALELISISKNLELLESFPCQLVNFFENIEIDIDSNEDQKFCNICAQWLKSILNCIVKSRNKTENFAYTAFSYLVVIYQIMIKYSIACVQLFKTAEEIVESLPDDVIFDAAFDIGKFKQPKLIEIFSHVLKRRFNSNVKYSDDQLLEKIIKICKSEKQQLNIPNTLCEDVVSHILTKLQENTPINMDEIDETDIIDDDFHKLLLVSSKFWVCILKATGSVELLNQHIYLRTVRQSIIQLAGKLLDRSIEIKMLKDILHYKDKYLLNYFSTISTISTNVNFTENHIQSLRNKYASYIDKLNKLNIFYKQFCIKATDQKDYLSDLTPLLKMQGIVTLEDTLQKAFWKFHQPIIEISQRSYIYKKSQTFKNVFENCLENNDTNLTVEMIAKKFIFIAFSDYDRLRTEYNDWINLDSLNISSFWKDVKDINLELELMSRSMKWQPNDDMKKAISYLIHIKSWKLRLEDLEKTLGAFRVQNLTESWVADMRYRLLKEPLTLLDLSKISNETNKHVYDFDDNCWAMIGALSYAGDFISWLQMIAEGDLRNLINGVDDKREIHEETVASLIEVKQFLKPLINDMVKLSKEGKSTITIISKFIDHVREIISKNKFLHEKISHCCKSSLALQNIYFSIVNRGEATKERIRDAVTRGSYRFYRDKNRDKCMVMLRCQDKSGKQNFYDLANLQDLQGQALLIAKQAASAFVLRIPDGNENSLEQGTKELMEFVHQIETVHQIIKYASKLMELGHFFYREWNLTANSAECMLSKLETLKHDLQTWKNIVQQAQEENYYLTFYTARHILTFYDYFSVKGHVNPKIRETCELLLRLGNKSAKLLPNRGDVKIDEDKMNFYEVLCKIGNKLDDMFTLRLELPRKINARLEPIVSDIVYRGKLFVAACTDKTLVPNIIMSFYANHKFYPEPWQLLMCRNMTTAEEVSLFIKRCFLASKNGFKDRLFCIAGLEFLEFELQYKLVNELRSFQETETDYYLALICCQENGIHHHILDQFSEYVRFTNGLGENTMKNMYRELCPYVDCVTSELSGQGKTEYIKNTSVEDDFVARSLLIGDNIHFDELVVKLKECKFNYNIESMHLNIISANNPYILNAFLFEFLTLGTVTNKLDFVFLPRRVFIEVASSNNERLLNSIPIVKYLNRVHLKWDITNFIVSHEITSPIQIVSHYLDAYDNKQLDKKDISFIGKGAVRRPMDQARCKALVQKYFFNDNDENIQSYRFVEIFLNVFADQLVRLSLSSFFNVNNIQHMVKDKNIRKTLLKTLLDVSKDFATRSIATKVAQLESIQLPENPENEENDQLETIVQWDASNHLLVFFLSQTPDSICALYRDHKNVPKNVKQMLMSQNLNNYQIECSQTVERNAPYHTRQTLRRQNINNYQISYSQFNGLRNWTSYNVSQNLNNYQTNYSQPDEQKWELDDYNTMSESTLLEKLESIARKSMGELKLPSYALSADNLLKMALILLRARANIPVVICGEAGCGKTSLISFLAAVVEVKFRILSLHAGIREDQIYEFMNTSTQNAKKGQIWLFFDEINTCNHIGLLSDLIAHRTLSGKLIHHNIKLFAACNPYRLRKKNVSNVGLEKSYQEQSKLVYHVHPLPDQILDYVWDYGVLKSEEEKAYIKIMVESQLGAHPIFVDLLGESQKFIRMVEETYTVSLRDVKRAIKLALWFQKSMKDRPPATHSTSISFFMIFSQYRNHPPKDEKTLIRYSFVLSLGLCYQSRLYNQDLRERYRECMAQVFKKHNERFDASDFQKIIRREQQDFMGRMVCPPSTADNDALLENIHVMIVCILNQIPVFIIGAPGSSKSLAVRLISSNLRGADSDDEYFKTLPQVYFIPHQGSASSTSAGILKVFDKAETYQKTSSEAFPVQAVVLLDEVGLAETSRFNPLKVLHALLEPGFSKDDSNEESQLTPVSSLKDPMEGSSKSATSKTMSVNKEGFKDGPAVSVVGISNWRLDNSKSSRALLVQRPKFDINDLTLTARMLLDEKTQNGIADSVFKQLASAYLDYEKNQKYKNFHGLRDYYALVKSLSCSELTMQSLELALIRNFGGTDQTKLICENYFGKVLKSVGNVKNYTYNPISVEKLINENLGRKDTRHLMVIGKSDSLVNILTYHVRAQHLDPVVLCGSQFPDDGDGDYLYAVLSKIMESMCVEAGRPLILSDLDIIYGSLYDLWNQNYITLGNREDTKYYARVALGAYSNPMLYVHPDFKCILAMDEDKLEHTDPPLLNRFEKQRLTINDILTEHQKELCEVLLKWAHQISTLHGAKAKEFNEKDIFIGFDEEETIQSLVFDQFKRKKKDIDDESIVKKCKERLIAIASSDGMVRARQSVLNMRNPQEVIELNNSYFNSGLHDDIESFLRLLLNDKKKRDNNGQLMIINTFSNINTDVKSCLDPLVTCQVDKLSTFKTEAQLQDRIKHFWLDSNDELLVLQCDLSTVNFGCIKLAKFIIEQIRTKYLEKKRKMKTGMPVKNACIILHIHREQKSTNISFDFICGWNQVTIGTLLPEEKNMQIFMQGKILNVMNSVLPFEEILEQELLWCLLCIKYPSTLESVEHIKYLVDEIPQHPRFINVLKQRILKWLDENTSENWQLQVASDKKVLYLHSSFTAALRSYIRIIVKKYIAKLLCALERLSALKTLLNLERENSNSDLIEFWYQMFNDDNIINIENLMDPKPDGFQNILSKIPALKHESLKKEINLYHKDFLTFISSGLGDNKNRRLIGLLLLRRLDISDNFEDFKKDLLDIAVQSTLDRIRTMDSKRQLQQWQLEVPQILLLCSELSTGPLSTSLHLLNICNDLVSKKAIHSNSLSTIINLGRNYDGSNNNFTDYIFKNFDNNEKNIKYDIAKQNFILRILDIIPLESPDRLCIYEKVFAQGKPSCFTSFTIRYIFRSEAKGWFSAIIGNPDQVLNSSPRLNVINRQLEKNPCDSQLAILCCDVIQEEFFAKVDLQRLKGLFLGAIWALRKNNVRQLQLVCAIALLKQFVKDLWSSATLEKALTEQIQFNFTDSYMFIHTLNDSMQNEHPLIQSLKFYFLKDLRARGLTMSDLRQFFNHQQEILSWLSDLPWNKDDDSRLPFNPYFLYGEYNEAEDALNSLNRNQLNNFLRNLESHNRRYLRISFIGTIVARLFVINATRKLNGNEKKIINNLRSSLGNISLSPVYKQLIMGLLTNENPTLRIDPRIDNKTLLIRLVMIHILAVHASLPDNHSPLTQYLHQLQNVRNTYILTCPSDEEAILMGALRSNQIQNAIANKNKTGYIMEQGSLERGKSVREMTASSYRILHLFVHTLIAFSEHSHSFLNNLDDPIAHCLDHITKDWEILKKLLNCNDEDLALIFHDILHSITSDDRPQSSILRTPEVRTTWECQFTTRYITNRTKSPTAFILSLRNKLQKAKEERKEKTISKNQHSEFISNTRNAEIIFSDNDSELLSALELLLCFIKRTTDIDADMSLKSYIQQWVKLSVLTENKVLEKVLDTNLQLKHAIALYELVEEKVADIMIESIAAKYKARLTKEIESDIMAACTFEQKDIKPNSNLIPADVFMRALKRFMYRQLLVETIKEDHPLSVYLTETTTVCCWPDNINEDLISNLFPMSLLIEHTHSAYHFIKNKIEMEATEKQNIMKQSNIFKEEQDQ
ncbi:45905_t:CDS:10 [Gigaspora margarita]|uniref:45905_t:CDS:1 n=1 Tax=Gigaspora margarita TaxID=4874 RepID=A0ABN7UCK8_GIGMA|nr:45905_t:CDS:10 [Gigaspora margarita]